MFSFAKYMINKSKQEWLRLPSRTVPEDTMNDLCNYIVKAIEEVDSQYCDKFAFVQLRNLECCSMRNVK